MDAQAGRRERAEAWLAEAAEEAAGSDEELASIAGVRGMNLSDAARYEEALEFLEDSVERARRSRHGRQAAWSASLLGRVYLLTARNRQARAALERSLEFVDAAQWIAFAPWPEALLAHLDLQEDRVEQALCGLAPPPISPDHGRQFPPSYCVYEAPGEERVRDHARAAGIPADAVYEIVTT